MLRGLLCCSAAVCVGGISLSTLGKTPPGADYWPHARGHPGRYSATSYVGPADLNSTLSWSWHHPDGRYHTVVVGGPLLDAEKNVYIASSDGVRKFSPSGELSWFYPSRGTISHCPSLYEGALFGNTENGWVFSLDTATGSENWAEKKAETVPGDTGYVENSEGVIVTGVDSFPGGGAKRVLGLDAKDGKTLWEYHSEERLWNVMAVFPGDGTWVVMDIHGSVQKHGLHNGTLLWKAVLSEPSSETFSDGGVILGPDGTPYSCSNYKGSGQHGEKGALRAWNLADGKLLWEQVLKYPCNSWPVVSPDGKSVMVPAGEFVSDPAAANEDLRKTFKKSPEEMLAFSLSLGNDELKTYGYPSRPAAIQSFDARTGAPQWSTELPGYGRLAARGDEEGFLTRLGLDMRAECLPAQFSAPTLSGDGTLYVGRADGQLYAVESGTGKFKTFDTGAGFLHPGTSWAPGMMAVASCDGLFVWNY